MVGDNEVKPPPALPESGEIKFGDVQMGYRDGLPLTLKGLTLKVRNGGAD